MPLPYRTALIVGAGPGISASLARALAKEGLKLGLAARSPDKLADLAAETGAATFAVDVANPQSRRRAVHPQMDQLHWVNQTWCCSTPARGCAARCWRSIRRPCAPRWRFRPLAVFWWPSRPRGAWSRMAGAPFCLTGASASVKGYPLSSSFAMGKFALRGLAQSAARELGPKGIHVAHFVIDGAVRSGARPDKDDVTLDPDGIAQTYMDVLRQPRNAWSLEVELRPWVETF